MAPHIFYLIKYSVEHVAEGNRSMHLAKKNAKKGQQAYKGSLFSESRLSLRERLFGNVTLPSLKRALEYKNAHVVILAAQSLPERYRISLEQLVAGIDRVTIHYLPPVKSIDLESSRIVLDLLKSVVSGVSGRHCIATVRLDDDDALANNYTNMLLEYIKPALAGFFVSFPLGVRLSIKRDQLILTSSYLSKTSQGMARVEEVDVGEATYFPTAYSGGSHFGVDKRGPVVLDSRFPAYIRTNHVDNDSGMRPLEWARHWIQVSAEPLAKEQEVLDFITCNLAALGSVKSKPFLKRVLAPVSSLVYRSM